MRQFNGVGFPALLFLVAAWISACAGSKSNSVDADSTSQDTGTIQPEVPGDVGSETGDILDIVSTDLDEDGVLNEADNCPQHPNAEQEDLDQDGEGDACDQDDDGDWVLDSWDNCPDIANEGQSNSDEDENGDACDDDDDNDDVLDEDDNCPNDANPEQEDSTGDGVGDACNADSDGDGVLDPKDNCPTDENLDQKDLDEDGLGDICDKDMDGDKEPNSTDNCPETSNEDQHDLDEDGLGDVCDDEDNLWLLSIDNDTHQLLKVDVLTGQGTLLCTLPTTNRYPSSTFSRSGGFFASNNKEDRLERIDPCTCEITPIGPYSSTGEASSMVGITSDHVTGLFGVETLSDTLVSINPETGETLEKGAIGKDLVEGGATWSDSLNALYVINGKDAQLYQMDPESGSITLSIDLDYSFGNVGVELHPANQVLYACTKGKLLQVDPANGSVHEIGAISSEDCSNLAAPYISFTCAEWPK